MCKVVTCPGNPLSVYFFIKQRSQVKVPQISFYNLMARMTFANIVIVEIFVKRLFLFYPGYLIFFFFPFFDLSIYKLWRL